MTAITVTAANISASEERGAVLARFVANVDLVVGEAVYLDATNKLNKAIADSAAHALAIGVVVIPDNFYAESTIKAGNQATVCVYGPVYGFTGLVSGEAVYVDKDTAGDMTVTPPTAAYQYVVGHAMGADTLFVDPGTSSPASA